MYEAPVTDPVTLIVLTPPDPSPCSRNSMSPVWSIGPRLLPQLVVLVQTSPTPVTVAVNDSFAVVVPFAAFLTPTYR